MLAKLFIKRTQNIDCIIYTDACESGWGAHDGVTSIEGGDRITKCIITLIL